MNSTYQIATAVFLIAVVAVGGYVFFGQSEGGGVDSLTNSINDSSQASTTRDVNRDQTLQRLNELEDITVDSEFLSSDTFQSLENFGISIEPQSVGRSNPFTPASVLEPAEVTDSSINIEGPANTTNTDDEIDSEGTSTQSTTSVDQLPESGSSETSEATSSPRTGNQ